MIARRQVARWLEQGIIEPIPQQPLNNNLVFVAKKNGDVRMCVDCTPVNRVTKEFDWPLPRLQDLRHKVRGARYFTRIDLKDAFFRIKVPIKWRHVTAFRVANQQYQFRRMPFGLKTAPSVFQRFMDNCLISTQEWAYWYIDDVLIWGETLAQLKHRTHVVSKLLTRAGNQINTEKSEYDRRSLLFAGIWLFASGIGPSLTKANDARQLQFPRTKKEMQSALGLVSYLRDFIPLTAYFTARLYPGKEGPSEAEARKLWELLIKHIQSAITTLRHWKEGVSADLYTDASGGGIGVIIIQKGHIVACASRKMTPAETRYSATDREHLGLVYAADKFKLILHQPDGATTIHTDHGALINRKWADLTPKQARWQEKVATWIPNLKHVKGAENPADYISRWGLEKTGGQIFA